MSKREAKVGDVWMEGTLMYIILVSQDGRYHWASLHESAAPGRGILSSVYQDTADGVVEDSAIYVTNLLSGDIWKPIQEALQCDA